jgi:hypothetical protein
MESIRFIADVNHGLNVLFWWLDGKVTPDPIPNSEVKLASGDDTPCGESS